MTDQIGARRSCEAWTGVFTALAREGVPPAERLAELATDDVRFRDPFNDVRGLVALQKILAHTRQHVPSLEFRIDDTAWSQQVAYVKWVMTGRLKWLGAWRVEGVSEIRFDDDGRVCEHLDHWDAAGQFYGRLPLIGWCLRRIGAAARVT